MSKIIEITSLKGGFGKTTLASLLSLKLSNLNYKVLAICNNQNNNDLQRFFVADVNYNVDTLRPYLDAKNLTKDTLKLMATKINNNLDFIGGSTTSLIDNTLKPEDLRVIREISNKTYDYIIIDNKFRTDFSENFLDVIDIPILVTMPSDTREYFNNLIKEKKDQEKFNIKNYIKQSLLVINFFNDEIVYEPDKKIIDKARIFKLNYSPNIINFCNGLKCQLDDVNELELTKLIEKITGQKIEKQEKEKNLLGEFLDKTGNIFQRFTKSS